MPNICNNKLEIITNIHPRFLLDENGQLDFRKIIPIPIEITDDQEYQFITDNWGTKWNAQCSDIDIQEPCGDNDKWRLSVNFETAWCSPVGYYAELAKHPDIYHFHAYFMDEFCEFCGGNIMGEEYFDLVPNFFYSEFLEIRVFDDDLPDSFEICGPETISTDEYLEKVQESINTYPFDKEDIQEAINIFQEHQVFKDYIESKASINNN